VVAALDFLSGVSLTSTGISNVPMYYSKDPSSSIDFSQNLLVAFDDVNVGKICGEIKVAIGGAWCKVQSSFRGTISTG
jgi:hypothetical protein